jgi:NitT/TauT family transport system substrate-binding protein
MKLAHVFKNFIDRLISELGFQRASFLPALETVSPSSNTRKCHSERQRRISHFLTLTKSRSFGYRLRMTLRHSLLWGKEATPLRLRRGKYFKPLVVIGFVLLACPQWAQAQLIPLNFVYTGSGSQSDALKFSHEAGFFRKRGLDLTMLYVTSGVTTSQTIVSGAAGSATTTATDALRAMAAGAPMKIVMVNIDQFQHLFVARPEIKNAKDMKGKRIAVSRYGAFSDIQTRFVVRQWGMDPDKDVQILQIGNSSARAAALASGGVDGAIVTPAFVPVARKVGLHVIFDLATIKTKFASQIMVAHDQLIKEKPELVKAVTMGFLDGIRSWKAQPEPAKTFIRKYYKVSEADVDNIYTETNRFLRSAPTPDLEGLQNAWDSIPESRGKSGIDLRKFVDARFVDEALSEIK